jgi:hypothetical protein
VPGLDQLLTMPDKTSLLSLGFAALIALCSTTVSGQERIFSLGLSGGITGSIDEDSSGFSNTTFQLRFTVDTDRHQNVAIRAGRMDFDGEVLGPAVNSTIDYVTVGGEYLFTEAGHESGFLLGLGYYALSGDALDGSDADEGALGLVIGAIGEFDMTERWFVSVDVLVHYAALDSAQIFASGLVGVGYRF